MRKHLHLADGPRSTRPVAEAAGASKLAVLTKDTEQTHIVYGASCMNAHHEDRFVLSILDTILGGGMSSRLFQEIREKKGLAYAVFSFHSLFQDTGQFAIYAGTRPANTEQVLRLAQAEIERISSTRVPAEELDRAKESIKGRLVLGMESTRNRMSRLGKSEVIGGELLAMDDVVERIEAVSAEDIRRVAESVFSGGKVLAMIGPHQAEDVEHLLG